MTGKPLPLSNEDTLTPDEERAAAIVRAARREHVLHLLSVQRLEERAAVHGRMPGRWRLIR